MPLPFLLAGAAAVAGITGIAKGVEASSNNSRAKELYEEAEEIFENAKEELEESKIDATHSLEQLGALKLQVWDEQFGRFINLVEQVKNVKLSGQAHIDTKLIKNISFSTRELQEMKEISLKASEVVSGGVTALGSGALAGVASYGGAMMFATASTGTAISSLTGVAATNATLAWFGGGSLAAGGLGMAGGAAVLGGLVAGPVLAVGGMIMAAKSRENLAQAKKHKAEARHAAEEMRTAASMLNAIESMSDQFYEVTEILNRYMTTTLNQLEDALHIARTEQSSSFLYKFKNFFSNWFKKDVRINFDKMTEEQKRVIQMSYVFAQTLKIVLETPLLNKDGSLDESCEEALLPAYELLEHQPISA
ncbi:hypothetical protein EJF36_19050 [Bacillus sp. HMF5848]|uniref:hypothetical protein n=1 Tax=Bacillus sp. HMF5848 TaxID=2495421 RepID=UPI000F79C9FA|nr:hypothetical protein [Bacillus sp. HMF5848]RSK28803.1 hypothetical protein EJF36_19050 [Bacillus sp. HMF5848]